MFFPHTFRMLSQRITQSVSLPLTPSLCLSLYLFACFVGRQFAQFSHSFQHFIYETKRQKGVLQRIEKPNEFKPNKCRQIVHKAVRRNGRKNGQNIGVRTLPMSLTGLSTL